MKAVRNSLRRFAPTGLIVLLALWAGYKLWDYLLFVVLLFALFEPWLANRISARLYGRPRATPAVGLAGVARNGRTLPQSSPEAETLEGSRR